ncbi:MAG TPA: alkaline phosphatase family protein [Actinomycetota bacterium]|nr:alkaline phosphatase family protein [Actinomycetota bacterium]
MPARTKRAARVPALRATALASLLWLLAASACVGGRRADEAALEPAPSIEAMARAAGSDVVERLASGYVEGRSGEIQLVPEPWSVLGQWNGGVRGPADPRTTHATPWSYHQRVPIVLYGPPFVRRGVVSDQPASVADAGATLAGLLGLDHVGRSGAPLDDALAPRGAHRPRAILVVVYDGGGWNVLERWPDAWPFLRRIAGKGATYVNATAGSAPTVTAPVHASLGTGTHPREHGIAENTFRLPSGEIGDALGDRAGDPSLLRRSTFADRWERVTRGRAWVGMVGYDVWHLPMMGAGTPGGDRDAAFLWDRHAAEIGEPWAPSPRYRLPRFAPTVQTLEEELRRLDLVDGAADGRWRDADLANEYEIPGTPAFASFVGEAAVRLVEESPVGRDDVTDLVFVELKASDYAGHLWNMESAAERDVLRTQDRILQRLVRALDRKAGSGRYVVAVTADHGQTPNPASTGGLRIDRYAVAADIEAAFGDVVDEVHPGQVFLDLEALRSSGRTVEDVARFLGAYRYREAIPEGTDVASLPAGALDRRVFAAALPGTFLAGLSSRDVAAFGRGDHPEGDLTTPVRAIEALVRG